MFTGIIYKTSKVKSVKSTKGGLVIEIKNDLEKVKLGKSININGVCSTVKKLVPAKRGGDGNIIFEYMPETLKLSNLGLLKKGDTVNMEQSMLLGDRFDGHVVLGHVDGKGKIVNIKIEGNSEVFEIKAPAHNFMKLLVYKGSVTVEGISLTVAKVLKNSFIVKIIPHTLEHTNLKYKKKGDALNLEFDILAKYANQK